MAGWRDPRPSDEATNAGASLQLPGDPRAPEVARRFLRGELTDRVPADVLDTVLLLGNELVTNAAWQDAGDIEIALAEERGGVRVEVSDRSPQLPHIAPRDVASSTGRGLLIFVQELATTWGVTARPWGKTVWFTVC